MMRPAALGCVLLAAFFYDESVARAAGEVEACVAASEDGQKLRDEGHYLRAHASFASCGHETCPTEIRAFCVQSMDDVDQRTPTVVLSAKSRGNDESNVSVSIDDSPFAARLDGRPQPIDPGEHRFRWVHGLDAPVDQTIVIRAGEKNRALAVEFGSAPPKEEPRRPGPPALAYVLVGVGVVGVTTGVILDVVGYGHYTTCSNAGASCDNSSEKSKALTEFVIGDSAIVVGLAAGAVATWLFLRHRDVEAPSASHVSGAVIPLQHGVAAGLSTTF
jgi:hypothetical protein